MKLTSPTAIDNSVRPWTIRVALAYLLAIGHANVAVAQQLEALRTEVRGDPPQVSAAQSDTPRDRDDRRRNPPYQASFDDDGEESVIEDMFGNAILWGITSPYWVPTALAQDDFTSTGYFLDHPYDDNQLISEFRRGRSFLDTSLFRLRFEAGSNFDEVSLVGGQILWDTPVRFAIDTEYNYRHEELLFGDDDLWTGDANIVYRFAQSSRMQMRSGIGFNWLSDSSETDIGFNFTYGGDFLPKDPFILSLESDLGSLGGETLVHGRATLGVNYEHTEIYGGYDYFRIGSQDIGSVVFGLRFWF